MGMCDAAASKPEALSNQGPSGRGRTFGSSGTGAFIGRTQTGRRFLAMGFEPVLFFLPPLGAGAEHARWATSADGELAADRPGGVGGDGFLLGGRADPRGACAAGDRGQSG